MARPSSQFSEVFPRMFPLYFEFIPPRSYLPLLPAKPAFSVSDFPDQTGRVAIVTGSNTGIGKATCKVLLQKGCTVYMAARSESKAALAIAELKKQTGSEKIYFLKLDLADLASIKATVAEFLR